MAEVGGAASGDQPGAGLRRMAGVRPAADKTHHVIKGAKHYYQGQPELPTQATALTPDWMRSRNLLQD